MLWELSHQKIIKKDYQKGIAGYIGGNTFLEMGFAHVLGKPLYLLNHVPDVSYTDELEAMCPIVIDGQLDLIK